MEAYQRVLSVSFQVILPADWNANDRELVIRAPLPSFFRHTMSKLKLKNDGSKKT